MRLPVTTSRTAGSAVEWSADWGALCRAGVVVCGLIALRSSQIPWTLDPGGREDFAQTDQLVVAQYIGDGDSLMVPGPRFAVIAGITLVAWAALDQWQGLRARRLSAGVGFWIAITSWLAAAYASGLAPGGGRTMWVWASVGATALLAARVIGELHLQPVDKAKPTTLFWAPLPLFASGLAVDFLAFGLSPSQPGGSFVAILAGCALLGASATSAIAAIGHHRQMRWYHTVVVAIPLLAVCSIAVANLL
jgi:hypothetical protein